LINNQQKNLYIAMSIYFLGNIQALGGDPDMRGLPSRAAGCFHAWKYTNRR